MNDLGYYCGWPLDPDPEDKPDNSLPARVCMQRFETPEERKTHWAETTCESVTAMVRRSLVQAAKDAAKSPVKPLAKKAAKVTRSRV